MTRAEEYRLLIADVYEVAGASRSTSGAIATQHGQTVARWHVLSVMSADALTVAEAARRLGLARQGVQRITNELVEEALLVARPNPRHAAAPLLQITPAGTELLRQLTADADLDREARLRRLDIDRAELKRARQTLQKVLEALRA